MRPCFHSSSAGSNSSPRGALDGGRKPLVPGRHCDRGMERDVGEAVLARRRGPVEALDAAAHRRQIAARAAQGREAAGFAFDREPEVDDVVELGLGLRAAQAANGAASSVTKRPPVAPRRATT